MMGKICILFTALTAHSSSGLSPSQCSTESAMDLWSTASSIADAATEELLQSGAFDQVVNGFMFTVTTADNCNQTGGGTNCDGFYVTYGFDIKSLPDGFCDEIPKHPQDCGPLKAALGVCRLCFSGGSPLGENTSWTANFVLAPGDAVAFFGCTPPPVEYFGWDPIVNARLNETNVYYPGTNFGNALSFRRTNTSDGTNGSKAVVGSAIPAPYSRPALVVHTADGSAAERVKSAFVSVGGVSPDAVTTHALDADVLNFVNRSRPADDWRMDGYGPDIISMIFRVTMAEEGFEDAFKAYEGAIFPVRLFLASAGAPAAERLTPAVMPREVSESETLPTEAELLASTLDALADAVKSTFLANMSDSKPDATFVGVTEGKMAKFGYYDDWDAVFAAGDNDTFVAPTRDCTYSVGLTNASFALNKLPPGHAGAGVIIGVVHTAANGTHANEVAYSAAGLSLFDDTGCVNELNCQSWRNSQRQTSWLNHRQLLGSAGRYFDNANANAAAADGALVGQLFAMDFLPDGGCSSAAYAALHSDWCFEYSAEALRRFPDVPPVTDPPLLPVARHSILPLLGERVYSQVATDTGPAKGDLLAARLLHFTFQEDLA